MKNLLIIAGTSDIATNFISSIYDDFNLFVTFRDDKKYSNFISNIDSDRKINKIFLDLSDVNSIDELPYSNYDSFDAVVFFNGVDIIKPYKLLTNEEIIDSFNINLISSMVIIKNLVKYKLLNDLCSVVFINSISGTKVGPRGHSLYSTTKSGINGLIMSLANEYSKKEIRFNSIASGLIETKNLFEKNSQILSIENQKKYSSLYPLGLGKISDITNLIKFLISQESKWITGQTIIIDGGFTIN